jgi:hypothetical protein
MNNVVHDLLAVQTIQLLFLRGPLCDADMPSAVCRDNLVKMGFLDRSNGWNWLTSEGVEFALNCLHLGPQKEAS